MDFARLFQFLEKLNENNHKEWMDDNRAYYHQVREDYIDWLDDLNQLLAKEDEHYTDTPGRKGINRINNNLLFHPNKPVYKDHFGAGLDQLSKQGDFYIHLGINECFIAGGYYRPGSKVLASIREAIDYNGEELIKILSKKSFKDLFGGLTDDGDRLSNAPKGFSKEHPYLELLKYKTFAVQHDLTREMVTQIDFKEHVFKVYREMLPFRRYLNQAVTV